MLNDFIDDDDDVRTLILIVQYYEDHKAPLVLFQVVAANATSTVSYPLSSYPKENSESITTCTRFLDNVVPLTDA